MKPIAFDAYPDGQSNTEIVVMLDTDEIEIEDTRFGDSIRFHWKAGHRVIEAIEAAVKEAREAEL